MMRTLAAVAMIGTLALAGCSESRPESAPESVPAPSPSGLPGTGLGPGGCGAPEAHIGPGRAQQTWTASTGHPLAVGGGLRFGTPAEPVDTHFTYAAVTLIVGRPGAVGSPTALAAGIGVQEAKRATVRDGRAPTKARVVFETGEAGRYPVWVLVQGTCGSRTSSGASPVGFVEVERSVSKACASVVYRHRRYFLSTSGPELGPGRLLGSGTGTDCEGGVTRPVQVFTISELSAADGVNVVYPGLGVRHYYP